MAYIGNGIAVTIVEANNVGSSQIIDFTVTSNDMSNTGVTAGTYGNSSAIPVLTVDQAGRVTAAVTNAVAGVTGFSYTNANNTFTITTGAGSTFSANIVANTLSNALTDTGVTAGAYGNSTAIPVLTVDAKGRVTSATTNAVAGVTGFNWTAANNTLTLTTSIGTYTANLNSWSAPVAISNTLAAGNTTITGFANITSGIQGGGSLTVAGALSGVTTAAMGNTTVTGFANVSSTLQVTGATTLTDLTVTGNLTTSGTTTYINTTNLNVGDNLIVLNSDLGAVAPTEDAGIVVNRGSAANVQFNWDETNDRWSITNTHVTGSLTTTGAGSVGTTLAAGNTTITGFANVSGITYSNSFIPTGSAPPSSSYVNFGVYNSGTWINSPTGTTGYLATAGGGVLGWSSTGVNVTGFANVSTTIQVTGGSTLTGAVTMANTLAVTGTSTFTGLITGTITSANNADYLDGQHGSYYAANSQLASYALLSGGLFTGSVNATSFTTTNFIANTTGVYPLSNTAGIALGSATQRWVLNANTINLSGAATLTSATFGGAVSGITTLATGNTTITGTLAAGNTTISTSGSHNYLKINRSLVSQGENGILFTTGGVNKWWIYTATNDDAILRLYNYDGYDSHQFYANGNLFTRGSLGVGITPAAAIIDAQNGARIGTTGTSTLLYATGTTSDSDYSYIAQFRHGNQSQGVGFRYNAITATGSNADQDLAIEARGAGNLFFRSGANDASHGTTRAYIEASTGHFLPGANNSYDIGSSTMVWRHMYTGDLFLSNEGHEQGNDVDGTKGKWVVQEGAEHLYIINRNNGKKYKFELKEIE